MWPFSKQTSPKKQVSHTYVRYEFENLLKKGSLISKTEFPVGWDARKIAQSCWEVYEHPAKTVMIDGGMVAYIKTIEGCTVQIVVRQFHSTHKIITAYPIGQS